MSLFATENKLIRRKGSHVVMGRMGMKVNETIPEGNNSGDSDSNDVPWMRTQTMAESYTAVHPNRARMKGKISTPTANNTKGTLPTTAGEDEGLGESIDQGSDKSENSITTTAKSSGGTPPVGVSHRGVSHRESDDEEDETTEGENGTTPDEIMLSPASLPGGVEVHAGDAWSGEAEVSNPVAVECNNTDDKQSVKKTVSFSTDSH